MGSVWARLLDPAWKEEIARLWKQMGNKDTLVNRDNPMTTLVVSVGAGITTVGLTISHIICDGATQYLFKRLVYQCYTDARMIPEPVPHLGNQLFEQKFPEGRPYRSSLSP